MAAQWDSRLRQSTSGSRYQPGFYRRLYSLSSAKMFETTVRKKHLSLPCDDELPSDCYEVERLVARHGLSKRPVWF